MEKEKLKIRKVTFSKIPKHESKRLLYECLDLILVAEDKNKNKNLNLPNRTCQQKRK